MRVLWFTNTSSCYSEKGRNTYGGGWISSLEREIYNKPGIELGICFYYNKTNKEIINGTTYYPIERPSKSLGYVLKQLLQTKEKASSAHERIAMPTLLKVVRDFKPDVIQVFGSENIYGLLVNHIDIPIVLHIQGILSSCYNTFLPPGISWNDYLYGDWNLWHIINRLSNKFAWCRNVVSEQRMFRSIRYVIGRTEWDKCVSSILGAESGNKYFHCDEILRDVFYEDTKRTPSKNTIFVTTISAFLYKGYDVILKTANILKNHMGMDFEWRVYGYVDTNVVQKKTSFLPQNVNVRLMGLVSAEKLRDALLSATAYVHTSYIENGCNAIGEAQMLGCPCIACDVGGVESSIENNISGFLIPSNDIYLMAYKMAYLAKNQSEAERMGNVGRLNARRRHDKSFISRRMLDIYTEILNIERNNKL